MVTARSTTPTLKKAFLMRSPARVFPSVYGTEINTAQAGELRAA
jgi:hypothetical protein